MATLLLFQPALSVAMVLVVFALIPWPGYAVLHLLGAGRHRWTSATFAGPPMTLALWTVAMSGAAWASVSFPVVSGAAWIAMLLLAGIGVALRLSVRSKVDGKEAPQTDSALWLLAAALALAVMPTTFHYGLGIFANSEFADGWSYASVADYLAHVARGTEGGLSPLLQYASHLMNVRNASSALLAHLSMGLSVKSDAVLSLYCLMVLFANNCALLAFGRTMFRGLRPVVLLALIAGFAMPALILYFANLDQLLLLPVLPLAAGIAVRAGRGEAPMGAAIALGILAAAAFLAYVEMAFVGLLVAASFLVSPSIPIRLALKRAALIVPVAGATAVLLAWPGTAPLLAMFKHQYATAQGAIRPGEGFVEGTLDLIGRRWLVILPVLAGLAFAGAWLERRRWLALLAFLSVAAILLQLVFGADYLYGAYKVASVSLWMICFFAVVGVEHLASGLQTRSPVWSERIFAIAPGLALLLATGALAANLEPGYRVKAAQQQGYREAAAFGAIIGSTPTLVSVRGGAASLWAAFYLSDASIVIRPYHVYMGAPHLKPFMDRAKTVDPAEIRYVVTDHDDSLSPPLPGARRIWDGLTYSLWNADGIPPVNSDKAHEPALSHCPLEPLVDGCGAAESH
jgi:hypothetical protein